MTAPWPTRLSLHVHHDIRRVFATGQITLVLAWAVLVPSP